ncbi:MAG: response regulator [Armatimonadetes bacterium]|nr:response regulator [Armatimonadota bacterium]
MSAPETILIIDDDPLVLKVLQRILSREGFQVSCAQNAEQAMSLAMERIFDLVIADVRMPETDGISVMQNLMEVQPGAGRIVITGYASEDAPLRAIKARVDDYFLKPFDTDELVRSIRQTIRRYRELKKAADQADLLRKNYLQIIKSLAKAMEDRDPFRRGHSCRVARHSAILAEFYGLTQGQKEDLELACYLHDLGYVRIEEEIIRKTDQLLDHEIRAFRDSPGRTADLLAPAEDLKRAREIIKRHSQCTGSGEEIPIEAKILAVANTFDALLSDRPHRKGHSEDEAAAILRDEAGKRLDPKVVNDFLGLVFRPDDTRPSTDLLSVLRETRSRQKRSLLGLAWTFRLTGDLESAGTIYNEILKDHREEEDPEIASEAMDGAAQVKTALGQWAGALESGVQALKLAEGMSGSPIIGRICGTVGLVLAQMERLAEGREYMERALALSRRWEDHREEARARLYLSFIKSRQSGPEEFCESMNECLSLLTELGSADLLVVERFVAQPLLERFLSLVKDHPAASLHLESFRGKAMEDPVIEDDGSPLRICCLGEFRITRKKGVIREEEWKTRKNKGLLAYLITHRLRPIPDERICEIFWPGILLEKGRANLRNSLHVLRRLLEPDLAQGADSRFLLRKGSSIQFQPQCPFRLDVSAFDESVKRGQELARRNQWEEAAVQYRKAEDLYGGDFLENCVDDDWTEYERTRLREALLGALTFLAEYFSREGKDDIALHYDNRCIQVDNACEGGYQAAMKSLYRLGKRDDAVKLYHRCQEALKSELDISPSGETIALYYAIVDKSPL